MEPRSVSVALTCLAPAKINLFLHVVGRRADGYHLLQTAFRLLDWGDELSFRVRGDGLVRRLSALDGVPEESDLVVRAARLLQETQGVALGVDISVLKRLPMGGGLGGGSSDAATVLLALNRLWGLNLSRSALQALGLRLGADVPFFIFGESAFAQGVGEVLQELVLPSAWYVVVAPPVLIPTSVIFSAGELTRNTRPIKIADFAVTTTRNDLEPVAIARFPVVGDVLDWLGQFGPARMTGSGACVFLQVADESGADKVLAACPAEWRAWKVRSLDRHPLHEWVGSE